MLGDHEADEIEPLERDNDADSRIVGERLVELPHALAIEDEWPLFERSREEGLHLRKVERLRVRHAHRSQPRFTQFVPSDPWYFAPAPASET